MQANYRPDIDGLRTVAVMSVLLYHFGVAGFGGGFVGVDVFFVISGFLITRIIVKEVDETGTLSFSRFYTRRARRLFPAIAVTISASFIFGFLLLSPEQLARFAGSAAFTLVSVSNVFFWWGSGYFDAEAFTKPLLHTWSLSIEEQFYLIWPAFMLLVLTRAKRFALAIVLSVCAFSLVAAEYLLIVDQSAAFFLLPARIVELGLGAALVWLVRLQPLRNWILELLLLLGLGMIAASIITFHSEMRFPGVSSLLPCSGAALAIYAGTARYSGVLLRNPLSVVIGKWSYSVYLAHWPIFVFFMAYFFHSPSPVEQAMLVALSLALGWAQYRFVEERFRHERAPGAWSRPAYALGCCLIGIAILVPSSIVWSADMWGWRAPQGQTLKTNAQWRSEERIVYCSQPDPSKPASIFTCQNHRDKDRSIVIWGDSHALHLVAGFSERFNEHNIYVSYMSGCVPQSGFLGYIRRMRSQEDRTKCIERNAETLNYLKENPVDLVVVTSAKRSTPNEVKESINHIIDQLHQVDGMKVIYLGDFIRPGVELTDCLQMADHLVTDEKIERRCTGDPKAAKHEIQYNEEMAKLITAFVPVNDIQCPNGICQFVDGTTPLFRDTHHLTIPGSIKFIAGLPDNFWVQ